MSEDRFNKLENDIVQLKNDLQKDHQLLNEIYSVIKGDAMGAYRGIIKNDKKQDEKIDKIFAKIDPLIKFCEEEKFKKDAKKKNVKWIVSVGSGVLVILAYVFDFFKKLITLLK